MFDSQKEKEQLFNIFKLEMPKHLGLFKSISKGVIFNKSEYTIELGVKGKLILHLSIVKSGYGKSGFGIYSEFLIKGGEILQILSLTGLDECESMPDDVIVSGGYHNLIDLFPALEYKGFEHYPFVEEKKTIETVKEFAKDVEKFYLPIAYSFVYDYPKAIKLVIDGSINNYIEIRNPFCATIALMKLTNNYDSLPKLILKAKDENNQFYDFHEAGSNFDETIVKPIKMK